MKLIWLLLALSCFAPEAFGLSLGLGSVGGVMQMPNSGYYMAVYGAYGDMALESQKAILRIGYVERPKFRSQGYEDQDSEAFVLIGTKFSKEASHGVYAYFGAGEQKGYIKPSDPEDGGVSKYRIVGAVAAIEYAALFHGVSVAVTHQTFLGYANEAQFKAYVLWPVTFFLLRAGVSL